MFSVVIPGRPCLTDIVAVDSQVNPTKFAFSFPLTPQFTDVVVFYLPGTILPQDTAAAIYIQLPDQNTSNQAQPTAPPPEFRLLGALTNDEPSALFKVTPPGASSSSSSSATGPRQTEAADEDEMLDEDTTTSNLAAGGGPATVNGTVTLGISIEPIQTLAPQVAQLKTEAAAAAGGAEQRKPQTDLVRQNPQRKQQKEVSTKVLAQRIIGNAFNFLASFASSDQDLVPLKSFRDWWNKFERKIEMDPGFLEKEEPNV